MTCRLKAGPDVMFDLGLPACAVPGIAAERQKLEVASKHVGEATLSKGAISSHAGFLEGVAVTTNESLCYILWVARSS